MKRVFSLFATLIFIISVVITGCKTDDTAAPIIQLKGNNPDVVVYKSAATYTEQGATAIDETDGDIPVEVYGTVNMNSAGEYELKYRATDAAGNTATLSRTVIVDAAPYLAATYSVIDYCGGITSPMYIDDVDTVAGENNKIRFTMFGYLANAGVIATIAGSTITIPQQVIYCGSPTEPRTFSGEGIFSDTTMLIEYTRITNTVPETGTGTYTKL
jgi:hypothetical protein